MTTKMTQKQIRELIDSYLAADLEIKKIEKYKEKIKEQLIALGEGTHRGNAGQVSVVKSETSRLNNDLLKAKYGEGLVDCYKTTTSITVRVSAFDKEMKNEQRTS